MTDGAPRDPTDVPGDATTPRQDGPGPFTRAIDVVFAAVYDRALAGLERAGLADRRAALLAAANGRTLEIGAGTGANLAPLADRGTALTSLVLVEPVAPMRQRLAVRVADLRTALPDDTRIVAGTAAALPVPDASIDTVISTLVLCSVPDQQQALRELRRVLAPGGRLLLLEHVVGRGRLRRRQQLIDPLWRHVGRGCRLTRDTRSALVDAGFDVGQVEDWRLPGGGFASPTIVGSAVVS
jgi:SAM-dependent methyltransferase